MEYYSVQNKLVRAQGRGDPALPAVCRMDFAEWKQQDCFRTDAGLPAGENAIQICKCEAHVDCIYCAFSIPVKQNPAKRRRFLLVLQPGCAALVDDDPFAGEALDKIAQRSYWRTPSLEAFVYDFLSLLIESDLQYLGEIENTISRLEHALLSGTVENFQQKFIAIRRELLLCDTYYAQLREMALRLRENSNGYFERDNLFLFELYSERVQMLKDNAHMLRELALQLNDLYRAQMEMQQNKNTRMLTVMATVFLPLTLLAGWYGMNFKYMPELQWRYGYLLVTLVGLGVVAFLLWWFHRKKLL